MIGCFLKALGRQLLRLILLHYVDDFFGTERSECVETAKEVFARLVRACLGDTAIAQRKLEHGRSLTVLGVDIDIMYEGISFSPSKEKAANWAYKMQVALDTQKLTAGEASKLAGKLQWASQSAFMGLGRALLRPIIEQSKCKNSRMKHELALALSWWIEVLGNDLRQVRPWTKKGEDPVHLFGDARSSPPRVAAVLFRQGALRNNVSGYWS